MKKAKTFIIPMLALAAFGLVACGGGQSSSQQSSSAPHASIDVDTIASVEITNKDAMKKDWPTNEGSRALDIKVLNTEGKRLSETVLLATGDLKVTTSNAEVADVVGAGVFAKAAGKATITVTCKGKTDTVEVNVVAPKVAQSVAATLQQIANLAQGETFPEAIMTKGVVKEITAAWDAGYGNISFKIKDADADNELLCYRVVPAEGIDGSKIKAGDEVVINGKIKNYNGTLEYDAGAVIQEWKDGGQQVVTKTKINEVAVGDKVDLTGRVEAKSKRSAILNDGTGHIFIFGSADAIGAITVGKTYNVTGSTAEKNGAVQVESPVFTEKDPINLAADTPVALTAEIANSWKAAGAKFSSADVKLYTWETVIGKSGSYLTYGIDGSTTNIQAGYTLDEYAALTEGTHYIMKAYFTGFSGGHASAAEDYANIVIIDASMPAGAVMIKESPSYIKVGGTGTVTAKTDGLASDTYSFTCATPNIATVDANTGVVTAVGKGTAEIVVTSKTDPSKSAVANIDIIEVGSVDDAYAAGMALDVTPSTESDQSKATTEEFYAEAVVQSITNAYYASKRTISLTVKCESTTKTITAYSVTVDEGIDFPPCVGDTVILGGPVTKFIKKDTTDPVIEWTGSSGAKIYDVTDRRISNVSLGAHPNATVEGLPENAENGEQVRFTATPAEGYKITNVKVNGTAISKGDDGKYFFDVTADSTITVETLPEGQEFIAYDFSSAAYKGKWEDGEKGALVDRGDFYTINSSNTGGYVFMASKTQKESATLSNKTAIPGKIVHIAFVTTTSASASAVYVAQTGTSAIQAHVTDDAHKLTGKGTLEWDVEESAGASYFAITCNTTKYNGQIARIEVTYVPNAE